MTAAENGDPGRTPVKARATIIPVTPFQQNCTLVWNEADHRGAVIDPGGDLANIERAIAEAKVKVERILITHGHVDHVGAAADSEPPRSRAPPWTEISQRLPRRPQRMHADQGTHHGQFWPSQSPP